MAQAIIGALRAELSAGVAKFADDMGKAGDTVQKFGKRFRKVGGAMRGFGQDMSTRVSAPLIAFGGFALKAAGDFEQGMNRVQAVSGATGDQLTSLSDLAKEMGSTTQFSASQAADAMGFLAQAGFEVDEIIGALPGTLELAAAAKMDLASAADIVSNVLSGYGMEVEELSRVNDVLAKTMTSANTDLQQLGEAMKMAGPVASAAGVRFEEAAAAMGMMGNAGIQATMAGTSLRGAISKMLSPTSKAEKIMKQAGLSFTDAEGRLLPLAEIIEQLEPHAEDAGMFMELFGQRAGPAMAAMVSQGSGALRELTGELDNAAGTAGDVAAAQMKGFNGAIKEMKSAFEGLQIAIADAGLLETVTGLIKRIAEWTRNLSETNPEMLRMGTIIAAVVAAAGPLIFMLGGLATGIGLLMTPIGGVVAGLAALATAFAIYHEEIIGYASRLIEHVDNALGGRLPQIIEAAGAVLEWFAKQWGIIVGMIVQTLSGDFSGALESFGQLWRNSMEGIVALLKGAAETIGGVLMILIDALDQALGGRLSGIFNAARATVSFFVEQFKLLFQALGQILTGDFSGALESFNQLWKNTWNAAVNIVANSVGEIGGWLKGKLGDIIDWVGNKLESMKQGFKNLYQAVVGGSYIPDMVDGIIANMGRLTDGFVNPAASMTQDVGDSFDTMGRRMRSVWDELVQTGTVSMRSLVSLAAKAMDEWLNIGEVLGNSPGGGGSFASVVGSIFGAAFGGGLATGGLAMAGRPYMVGERGPELFRPHVTGTVDPDASGGGVTQVFNVTTPDANSFRRSERQIMRSARQSLAMG